MLVRIAIIKKSTISKSLKNLHLSTINVGEGVEKREHSYTVAGNVNWYSGYGE